MPGTITPIGVNTPTAYNTLSTAGLPLDSLAAPGNTNAPIIFEPDAVLTGGVPEVWMVASGGFLSGAANASAAAGTNVLTFASIAGLIPASALPKGCLVLDLTHGTVIPSGTVITDCEVAGGIFTVTLSNNITGAGVVNGDVVGFASPFWGGAQVWISSDGNTYAYAGTLWKGTRQGILTANLPSHADPDSTNTLSVDITESLGQLLSGTMQDADDHITLCLIDSEFVSYETATLTATYKYDLTYLRRGVYGTTIASHSGGAPFARFGLNDPSIFKYAYPTNLAGRTIYIKLLSFNNLGQQLQEISHVSATTYILTGKGSSTSQALWWGRMSDMTIQPIGAGLTFILNGTYAVGAARYPVSTTVTLPNTANTFYIIGDAAGNVGLTTTLPPSVWPASNLLPILLATITPINNPVAKQQCLPFGPTTSFNANVNTLAAWGPGSVIRPNTIQIYHGTTLIGTDDGLGAITGATIATGSVNYSAGTLVFTTTIPYTGLWCNIGWTATIAVQSWIKLYPPVDNPIAQECKAALDNGTRRIPGYNAPVGLPNSVSALSLSTIESEIPYGYDSYSAGRYRINTGGREYVNFALTNISYYFAPSAEVNGITFTLSGGAITGMAAGLPSGSAGPLDPTTMELQVFDAGGSGANLYIQLDASVRYGNIGVFPGGGGSGYIAPTGKIVGGGIKDAKFRRGLCTYNVAVDGAFIYNDVGVTDRRTPASNISIEDYTIVHFDPDQGAGQAIAFPNGLRVNNVMVNRFAVVFGQTPMNSEIEWVCGRNIGIGGGSHGAGINWWGGLTGQTIYATSISGQLYIGWTRLKNVFFSAPSASSPAYTGCATTALLAFENFGPSEPVGTTDYYDEGGLLDGGTFSIVFLPAHSSEHAPIRRIAIRNKLFTRNYEYGIIGFNSNDDLDQVLFINPRWEDSGEKILIYGPPGISDGTPLEGLWSCLSGSPVRSPLPAVDWDGNPIQVTNG